MESSEAVKDLFSTWMRWPQRATEMWGRMAEKMPKPSWPSPPAAVPFGSPQMAEDWMKMSRDLMTRYASVPMPGVAGETSLKSMDALKVYWALYEFWLRWIQGFQTMRSGSLSPEKVAEASETLRAEYEKVAELLMGGPPPATSREMFDLQSNAVQGWLSLMEQFRSPWTDLGTSWPDSMRKVLTGDPASAREGVSLWQKSIVDTLGKLLNMPSMGMSREHEQRVKSAMDAYLRYQEILPVYYSTFQDASRTAFERLVSEGEDLAADTSPEGFRRFYRKWVTIHEDTFFELFRKPEFAALMNRVVQRGLTLRQRVDDINSRQLQVMNMPTRGELDDVYQTLYRHRTQIKALERRLAELESGASAGNE